MTRGNFWLKEDCEVCGDETEHCIPSPFGPYSYWRCKQCYNAKRIKYGELLGLLEGTWANNASSYDDAVRNINRLLATPTVKDYAGRYFTPTLEFYKKTKDQAWKERKDWEKYE